MREFIVVNRLRKPIGGILWDVDGVITRNDRADDRVLERILRLALMGIPQRGITGRDTVWLDRNLVGAMKRVASSCGFSGAEMDTVMGNISFAPELGTIVLGWDGRVEVSPRIEGHPLLDQERRALLSSVCWTEEALQPWQEGEPVPRDYQIRRDANGNPFLVPVHSDILLPGLIFSEHKKVIGTLEFWRDSNGKVIPIDLSSVIPVLQEKLREFELERHVVPSPVGTAINLVPIVDREALDKDWAGGSAILEWANHVLRAPVRSVEEISSSTACVGDGRADFLFTKPRVRGEVVPGPMMIYVGGPEQYDPDEESSVFIRGQGSLVVGGATGPDVVVAALDYMDQQELFVPFQA